MRIIGEINPKHFENVFTISTNDVVITEKQIEHIKERHPQVYELYIKYIPEVLKYPDYILQANKPNSAVLIKSFTENGEHFQLVLRLKAPDDPTEYQNSIITFWKISESDLKRLTRNKKILYKSR